MRERVSVGAILVALLSLALVGRSADAQPFEVDHRSRVGRADLTYTAPTERSEEGMPVGNGRTGSLVWTTPNALRFQLNRNDVFATSSATHSFPARTDYSAGCAYLDVHLAESLPGAGDLFSGDGFKQHLSVYDGVVTTAAPDVTARVLAWQAGDVFAIEVDDRRSSPAAVHVDLRMLRYAMQRVVGQPADWARRHAAIVQTNAHTAVMQLGIADGRRITLTQAFREGEHYNGSAAAATVIGRTRGATYHNESTVRLTVAPARGKFTILVSTAATFDPVADVAASALKQLDAAAGRKTFDTLLSENQSWWRDYWARSFVRLTSADGEADFVERNYTYFLYVMAACSRNSPYPARFGGLLFYSNGDMRSWGAQYWWANQSCYYNGFAPADRPELLDPTFGMYSRMYDRAATAARQQWGSQGIWIPETSWFDGLAPLPDDVAAEMRELYLLRKPWAERSERFRQYCETVQSFNSRWNWMAQGGRWEEGRWIAEDKGNPPFGHVTHIFGTTAKIAYLYWQRYEYTLDERWLRDRAYPMLKGTIEFYRHFPNLKRDADGKYHLYHTNSNEPAWGVKDSDEDLSAMHGLIGPLLRASEILNVDADLRPAWREFRDNLAPLPTTDHPDALKPADYAGPRTWVKGLRPAVKAGGVLPDRNTLPMWNFELCTVETPDAETLQTARNTFEAFFRQPIGKDTSVGTLSRLPIAAAQLGRADAVRHLLPNQLRASDAGRNDQPGVLRNNLALREGPGAIECERLGRVAEALHAALLHSAAPAPGAQPILRVFPAWPAAWDADFTLAARGNFLVSASMQGGVVAFVHLHSRSGADCRLRNPWPGKPVTLHRAGRPPQDLAGELLTFPTATGESVTLTPKGTPAPAPRRVP